MSTLDEISGADLPVLEPGVSVVIVRDARIIARGVVTEQTDLETVDVRDAGLGTVSAWPRLDVYTAPTDAGRWDRAVTE